MRFTVLYKLTVSLSTKSDIHCSSQADSDIGYVSEIHCSLQADSNIEYIGDIHCSLQADSTIANTLSLMLRHACERVQRLRQALQHFRSCKHVSVSRLALFLDLLFVG